MNEDNSDGLDVVDDRQARITKLKRKLDVAGTNSSSSTVSIYRIPTCFREVNSALYEPKILSLGPYHHGKPQFQAMDELKWCYFKSFLRRNQYKNVEDYYELVENNENEARSAYSEQEPSVVNKNFVEMMLLDCCFMLQFLLILSRNEEWKIMNPIFNSAWTLPHVLGDMLLLENQLPFFLLESLLKLNIPDRTPSFTQIVLDIFGRVMPGKIQKKLTGREDATVIHIHHILHLMYSRIIPMVQEDHPKTVDGVVSQEQRVQMPVSDDQTPMPEDHPNSCWFQMFKHGAKLVQSCCLSSSAVDGVASQEHPNLSRASLSCGDVSDDDDASEKQTLPWIPSAKRLSEAGVVFKRKTKYKSFLDVTFDRGTMEIPRLQISGNTESIFNNLIAFEQCHTPIGLQIYFSSYALLMNLLSDTTADVELLEQEGIIVSCMTSDEEIAILFNQLGKHATIHTGSHLKGVYDAIKNHWDKGCNRSKAMLNHKYFGNPWAFISLIAAIILFALTFLQTLLAFLTYYQ